MRAKIQLDHALVPADQEISRLSLFQSPNPQREP